MNKLKKIITSLIITILAIFGISTVSNAYNYQVGQYVSVSVWQYLNSPDIYCMEREQKMFGTHTYKVISQINIEGRKSTDFTGKEIYSDANAKFADILSATNPTGSSWAKEHQGPVANGVWNYGSTWFAQVGQYHAGLYRGFASSWKGFTTTWLDTSSTKYANSLKQETKIKDNTNKDNVEVTSYEKDGKSYLRVGPFNWTFNGELKDVKLYNQDQKEITEKLYSRFNGTNETWFGVEGIKSGSDFYVSVPGNGNITKITKISGEGEITVKGVKVWFLDSVVRYIQNLLVREPYTSVEKYETTFDYNIQTYMKLSGYVWVDRGAEKRTIRNELYKDNDYDKTDILLDGVTVRLKDRETGKVVAQTKTANGGAYQFDKVLISKVKKSAYYIEFEYDGLTYTNVTPHLNKDNGSKSVESATLRNEFNKNFSIVEGESENTGFTRDANGNRKYNLTYNLNKQEHTSTLIHDNQFIITANTDDAGYKLENYYNPQSPEEIKYINLGLYEREMPDIAVEKDLENVKLGINNYNHVYKYAQRFLNQGEYGDGFNVGVKFGNKYGSMKYTRAIYKSDLDYQAEDKGRELQVYATYKIGMLNQTTTVVSRVNDIVDYFDSKYEIVKVGTKIDEATGEVTEELKYQVEDYNDKYKKATIETNAQMDPEKMSNVYVQFKLSKEAILSILDNDKENLNNIVEIKSYSSFDTNGNPYAGVDNDSNPGNITPGDVDTYQDDTDSAPGLLLQTADAREISGKVFEDATTGELMTGKVRQGSGAYEEGEKGIQGVKVTLTENTGTGKIYEAETNENGDYTITGFIPGDYTITYTWGDKTYTVQNYKGTIYDETRDRNNKKWYKDNVDARLTDALDDYELRQKIDSETAKLKYNTETSIDKMNSSTPTMGIGVEYEDIYTASTGDRYVYKIRNIDFGIVERPRQELSLIKRVKSFKTTLANGQIIADFTIDENGKMHGSHSNVTYMKPSPTTMPSNGFVRLEIDKELMQGATVEVEYEIKAINNSELEYLSQNFYHFGKQEGELVTLTPSAIIDYLDNDWAFDTEKNSAWKILNKEDLNGVVAETVYKNTESNIDNVKILYTESLKNSKLKPTEAAEVTLNVSKILSNSAEDIALENETELVEIEKTGGAKTISTPGNYVPGTEESPETDDDKAEYVLVTPPTGKNLAFIIPVTIGIIALAIIGVGTVVIKKKTLNNNK